MNNCLIGAVRPGQRVGHVNRGSSEAALLAITRIVSGMGDEPTFQPESSGQCKLPFCKLETRKKQVP